MLTSFSGQQHTFRITKQNGATIASVLNVGEGDIHDAGMEAYKRTVTVTVGVTSTFIIYPAKYLLTNALNNSTPSQSIIIILVSWASTCSQRHPLWSIECFPPPHIDLAVCVRPWPPLFGGR